MVRAGLVESVSAVLFPVATLSTVAYWLIQPPTLADEQRAAEQAY
jgi:hypothetical protein